jgi:hypothetical protein
VEFYGDLLGDDGEAVTDAASLAAREREDISRINAILGIS